VVSDPMLPVGTNRCRYTACGRCYGGVGGFVMHQRDGAAGQVVCLDPADLGLVERGGYWVRPRPEAFASREAVVVATGSPNWRRTP